MHVPTPSAMSRSEELLHATMQGRQLGEHLQPATKQQTALARPIKLDHLTLFLNLREEFVEKIGVDGTAQPVLLHRGRHFLLEATSYRRVGRRRRRSPWLC